MDVATRLSDFAARVRPGATPLAVMRLSLFDWAICAIAGAGEPVSALVRAQAEAEGGAPQASVAGAAAMLMPARAAALANGAISHALDYDDTHLGPILHPSVTVIPAVLAVAERQGAGGDAFLRAALIGAEAAVRMGLWLGPEHAARGFHPTATAGVFGATLGAGALIGLSPAAMGQALALAASRAGGVQAQFGGMGKALHAGFAAAAGVEVADLAQAGMIAQPGAIDGPMGFGAAAHGAGRAEAFHGLGGAWQMERVSYKLHACCHGLHAMLEALGGLRLGPGTVDRVTVRTHPRWRGVCDLPSPRTGLEAKFSFRLTAAMVLAGRDTSRLDAFTDAACSDPELVALRDKVDVVADRTLPETAAVIDVTATGGRAHRLTHDLAQGAGAAGAEPRLSTKAAALLGQDNAQALATATLAETPDIPALAALLRAASTEA